MDKWRAAGAIASGFTLLFLGGVLLLWVYAWSLTDRSDPDYYLNKLDIMFRMPDPGIGTWFGLALSLAGCLLIVYALAKVVRLPWRRRSA